jgi:glycosyltransferase involved in cell wall biosynthesis
VRGESLSSDSASPLVVLPAFNEAAALPGVAGALQSTAPDVDVLVVDDGSTDGTADVARSAGLPVAKLPYNLGVGGAMRTGFRYALDRGYAVVVQLDADGQHNPGSIIDLLAALEDHDIAVGSRFGAEGGYEVKGPRRWVMRLLASLVSRIAGTRIDDATSGFRAAGPRAIEFFAREYPAEYLGDTVESLVLASRAGLSITQVPVSMSPRAHGQPSQGPVASAGHTVRAIVATGFALVRLPVNVPSAGVPT